MNTRFALITEISLPLGSVYLDGSYDGAGVWIDFLVAMPCVHVLRYSIRQSAERHGIASAVRTGQWVKAAPTVKHRRISFTCTTLYSPWPVGQEYGNARDFCDLFLSEFFQWPAEMCSNRSDVFKSSFASISEQAEITVASMQGMYLCPSVFSRRESSNKSLMISTEARDPAGPEGRVTENAHPPNPPVFP